MSPRSTCPGTASGLRVVTDILADVDDIAFCRLTSADVVRHRLVGEIIDAYARWDEGTREHNGGAPRAHGRKDERRRDR